MHFFLLKLKKFNKLDSVFQRYLFDSINKLYHKYIYVHLSALYTSWWSSKCEAVVAIAALRVYLVRGSNQVVSDTRGNTMHTAASLLSSRAVCQVCGYMGWVHERLLYYIYFSQWCHAWDAVLFLLLVRIPSIIFKFWNMFLCWRKLYIKIYIESY